MIHARNVRLLVVLVLLVAVDWLTRPGEETAKAGPGLLAGLDLADVAALRIVEGEQGTTLERCDAGWTVRERDGFPAHAGAVEALLAGLATLGPDDLIATEEASVERLGLDAATRAVELRRAGGEPALRLLFGKTAEGERGSVVRVEGANRVWRAVALEPPPPTPAAWLASRVLELDPPRVRVVRVTPEDGTTRVLTRGEDGLWSVAGSVVSVPPRHVDPLLLVASTLYVEDAAAEKLERGAAGLDPAVLRLSFELDGGGVLTLELGGELERRRAVTSSAWPAGSVGLLSPRSAANLEGAARALLAALDG